MYKSVCALFEPLRLLNYDEIGIGYTRIGDEVSVPAIQIWFDNLTNVHLAVSHNGVVPHLTIASRSSKVIDITANSATTSGSGILCYPANTQWFVSYIYDVPTSGFLSMSVLYGRIE